MSATSPRTRTVLTIDTVRRMVIIRKSLPSPPPTSSSPTAPASCCEASTFDIPDGGRHRAHRPERRREVHRAERRGRTARPAIRPARRPRPPATGRRRVRAPGHPRQRAPADHRARDRDDGPLRHRPGLPAPARRRPGGRRRRDGGAWPSPTWPTARSASCPAASASGPSWPRASPRKPRCSCSTSRSPGSTSCPASTSSTPSPPSGPPGRAVLVSTHDLGDAAAADHLLLLAGRVVASGPPDDVLTEANLADAYGGHLLRVGEQHADPRRPPAPLMTLDLHATAAEPPARRRPALHDAAPRAGRPARRRSSSRSPSRSSSSDHPGLAQSSAYRNLAVLERAGVVHRIVTSDEFARYELAEDLTHHHHHLICSTCGGVTDFEVSDAVEHELESGARPRRPAHRVQRAHPSARPRRHLRGAAREAPCAAVGLVAALPRSAGCADRGVVSGPPSDTGAGTWAAVTVAVAAAIAWCWPR